MNNLIQNSSFVKPHFNEKAGFEGLWDWELAQSLGVLIQHVREKWRRNKKTLMKLGFNVYTLKSDGEMGRPAERVFFSTPLAKYFVATWVNDLGISYFRFLLECEKVATELTPTLIKKIEQLEAENEVLKASAEQPKQLNKGKFAIVPVFGKNLWDEDEVVAYEYVEKETASPVDVARGKLHHNAKVQEGLLRSSEKAQSIIDHAINGIKKTTLILWQNPGKDI